MTLRVYDIASGNIFSPDLFMLFNKNAWQNTIHPVLLYTNRRSYEGVLPFIEPGGTFTVETNAHGFRTHEFFPRQANEYRIMILGDSFTYGYNANQSQTYPAMLERLLQDHVTKNITVYSLGVPGYSTIQYALLTNIYLDYLKPNLVIVAEDLSDFSQDAENIQNFALDQNGIPLNPKELPQPTDQEHFAIGQYGRLTAFNDTSSFWVTKLLFGSSLFHHLYRWYYLLYKNFFVFQGYRIDQAARKGNIPVTSYEQLVRAYRSDFSQPLPQRLRDNIIPYNLPTAQRAYGTTFKLLQYIRDETKKRNISFYLSSYPYPWMVSTTESVPYQVSVFGRIYDFRDDLVPTQLMDGYANALGVTHINAYPTFLNNPSGMYGKYDPHFSEKGYAAYAEVLYEGIKDEVQKAVSQ